MQVGQIGDIVYLVVVLGLLVYLAYVLFFPTRF